jgi:hypothetical protein
VIVWVLWEDRLSEGSKHFGPHTLLLSCLQDDFGGRFDRRYLAESVRANPKNSNSKVLAELKRNLNRLSDDGMVFAVFDRDQAHRMWSEQPARCLTALLAKVRGDAHGLYEVVFLDKNVETLLTACCKVLGKEPGPSKPNPAERDTMLNRLAFQSSSELRTRVRAEVASFDRLVKKIHEKISVL